MAQFTFRIGGGGESAESNALLRADFEPVAWLQGALADERGVKATSSQIESDLNLVNQELGSAVSKEYNTMLTNVHSTRALESKLSRSNDRVETLAQAVQRIQNQCAQPYSKLSAATQTLKRMQDCSELLRRAQRVVVLCKRMRESMSPTSIANTALPPSTPSSSSATPDAARAKQAGRLSGIAAPRRADLAKAASALHELEDVLAPFDALREVDVVRAEMDFIRETADSIRSQAKATLSQGIVDHSQAHIGTALQIFFNLGELRAAVLAAAEELARGVNTGKDGQPAPWTDADAIGERVSSAVLHLVTLQRALSKKRDPLSHTLFSSLFERVDEVRQAVDDTTASDASTATPSGQMWACAAPDLLRGNQAILSMLAANEDAMPGLPASLRAESKDTPDGGDERGGLGALWAPLLMELRRGIEQALSASAAPPSTELPRVIHIVLAAVERAEKQLLPNALPDEARRSLNAQALLDGAAARGECEQELAVAFAAACEGQLTSASRPLSSLVESELARCAGVVPLQRIVVSACVPAIDLYAHRADASVLGTDAAAAAAPSPAHAAKNHTLLVLVQSLWTEAHAAIEAHISSAVLASEMRASLSALEGVCARLANPATPLPEESRTEAAAMLKSVLSSKA